MLEKIIIGIIALAVGILAGYLLRKSIAESKIQSAEAEAQKIIETATTSSSASCL